MANLESLIESVNDVLADKISTHKIEFDELTIEVPAEHLLAVCKELKENPKFQFTQLIDLAGVDYLTYGQDEWQTDDATGSGFGRGVQSIDLFAELPEKRFAVAYHLLSVELNQRLRLKCFAVGQPPMVDSVIDIWSSANWFEREAFDLYGILFDAHPDLRRILTDYGFIGHPFRKDFPLSGHLEVRYDPTESRVIYQPVSIEPRTLVPRVIRQEHLDEPQIAPAVEENNG